MGRRAELTQPPRARRMNRPTGNRSGQVPRPIHAGSGRCRRAWRRVCGVAIAVLIAGCFPPVIHGPRVDDGLSVGGSVAITRGPTYTEGDFGGIRLRHGQVGLHAGHGWAAKAPNRPGFFAGVVVPVYFPLAQLNLFMQLPPAWTRAVAAGLGVAGGSENISGYAQVGRVSDGGRGWFLTQGVSQRARYRARGSSTASLSGAALQFTRRSLRTYVHLQYAFGDQPGSCPYEGNLLPCIPGPRSHAVSLGTTVEWRRPRRP